MAANTVDKWILDYFVHHLWEEFKTKKFVTERERELVNGIVDFVSPIKHFHDNELRTKLLMLPCFLVDGQEYTIVYENNDGVGTVLERMLDIFLHIIHSLRLKKQKYEEIISAIKRQAVIVCCEEGDFKTAQVVYNRHWTGQATKDSSLLQKVIQKKDINHEYIQSHSYNDFLDLAIVAMETFHKQLSAPFLMKVAETNLRHDQECVNKVVADAMNGNESDEISFSPNSLHDAAKALGEKRWHPYSSKGGNSKLHAKLHKLREKTKTGQENYVIESMLNNKDCDMETDEDTSAPQNRTSSVNPVEEIIYESRKTRNQLEMVTAKFRTDNKQYRRNINRENRHNPVDPEDITTNGEQDSSIDTVLRSARSPTTSMKSSRGSLRVPWTGIEERKLIAGVDKYGKGHWAQILNEYCFPGRTGPNLKDKWRNLVSQGRVK